MCVCAKVTLLKTNDQSTMSPLTRASVKQPSGSGVSRMPVCHSGVVSLIVIWTIIIIKKKNHLTHIREKENVFWRTLFESNFHLSAGAQLGLHGRYIENGCGEMSRGKEHCKNTPTPHILYTDITSRLSGVLSADVQLSLRDVNSFGGWVSTGGYQRSQRGEGHRRVEEAVLGEPHPVGGGHLRLDEEDSRQVSVRLTLQWPVSPETMFLWPHWTGLIGTPFYHTKVLKFQNQTQNFNSLTRNNLHS